MFFKAAQDGTYSPRTINFDLEPSTLDRIKFGPLGRFYSPNSFIHGPTGAGNNWAKGHYTEGPELIDEVMDLTRQQIEHCDNLQGFQVCHSLGGGTGSGMGTLLISRLREEYPDRIISTYSVFPSRQVLDVIVEPYNAILAIHQLIENSDEVFVLDNEVRNTLFPSIPPHHFQALYQLVMRKLGNHQPSYGDLNALAANAMTGATACLRFPGHLNSDLRKLGVNLIPFPRLHFFLLGIAPLVLNKQRLSVEQLLGQVVSAHAVMAEVDPRMGRWLTGSILFRGDATVVPPSEVDQQMTFLENRSTMSFAEWIPHNFKTSICSVPPFGAVSGCSLIANTTAMAEVFTRIRDCFNGLFRRRAFLHWFTMEGMEEAEFTEAVGVVDDLIGEYQQHYE